MPEPFGFTRLRALPARDVRQAGTFAPMYAVEPVSTATVRVDAGGLTSGDVAGLVLFNRVSAWIGVERDGRRLDLVQHDDRSGTMIRMPLGGVRVWLRAECDFARSHVGFRVSADGRTFSPFGEPLAIGNQSGATRAICCALFCCGAEAGGGGGHADFDSFVLVTATPARPDGRP